MKRTILGFRLDEDGNWIANLDCAHSQHVRYDPPFCDPPWVVSEARRKAMLGTALDRALRPDGVA